MDTLSLQELMEEMEGKKNYPQQQDREFWNKSVWKERLYSCRPNSITQHSMCSSTKSLWPHPAHRVFWILTNTLKFELQIMTLPYPHFLRYQITARYFGINPPPSYWAKRGHDSIQSIFHTSLCKAVFLHLFSKGNRNWGPIFTLSAKPAEMAAHTNILPPPGWCYWLFCNEFTFLPA